MAGEGMEAANKENCPPKARASGIWAPGRARYPCSYDLADREVRYRQRYLDMIVNQEVKTVFQVRAAILRYIREFLHSRGFLEVETSVLNRKHGGGIAEPFFTHHDDSGSRLALRIAPELQLKPLLVAGHEAVYEIGKQFRNEGIDATHSSEFTSCELYKAYADYNAMVKLTEALLSGLVKHITGGYEILLHSDGLDKPPVMIDFTPPFRRIDMIQELEEVLSVQFPTNLASDKANLFLRQLCKERDVKCSPPYRTAKLLDNLVGHFLEGTCLNPAFILHPPVIMSPFAKQHRTRLGLTERFEMFVNKHELINSYTELNDPVEQRKRFNDQIASFELGDDEAMVIDEDFITSLEYGLPPCAGWGIGIDRLVMLLTDSVNINEVLLSPAMKPNSVVALQHPDKLPEPVYVDEFLRWRASDDGYPHKFDVSMSLWAAQDLCQSLRPGQQLQECISVAGRAMLKNGKQLVIETADDSILALNADFSRVQRGDIVGLTGFPGKTEQGDVCLFTTGVQLLAPCLHLIPMKTADHIPMKAADQGNGHRLRYLDIIVSAQAKLVVRARDAALRFIRYFFHIRGFMEFETAILAPEDGAKSAERRPFVTYHKDLHMNMCMRRSSAFQLKKLIIAGYEGVYEIGKRFFNEAVDATHYPESTCCELYKSCADYKDVMSIIEELVSGVVKFIYGQYELNFAGGTVDFTPPFRRLDLIEGLENELELKLPTDLDSDEANSFLSSLCEEKRVRCSAPRTTARLLSKLTQHFIVARCAHPIFILDHPLTGQFTARHSTKTGCGQSFQLFVNKFELVNGQTDLRDVVEMGKRGVVSDEILTAFQYGMAPCAGASLELDLLLMVLCGFNNIKDVLSGSVNIQEESALPRQLRACQGRLEGFSVGHLCHDPVNEHCLRYRELSAASGGIATYVLSRGLQSTKLPTVIVPSSLKPTVEKLLDVYRELDQGAELKVKIVGLDVGQELAMGNGYVVKTFRTTFQARATLCTRRRRNSGQSTQTFLEEYRK